MKVVLKKHLPKNLFFGYQPKNFSFPSTQMKKQQIEDCCGLEIF